jgi:hypothetical protein
MTERPTEHSNGPSVRPSENRGTVARGRAVELLDRVLSSNAVTIEALAKTLMVQPKSILEYRAGRLVMPLEVQLLLVALTIERVPTHRRLAHQLRSQIKATISYTSGDTVTHFWAPPKLLR